MTDYNVTTRRIETTVELLADEVNQLRAGDRLVITERTVRPVEGAVGLYTVTYVIRPLREDVEGIDVTVTDC